MVNLQKWDFISYKDITEGDDLKVIITGEKDNLKTKTVTRAKALDRGWNAWYADNIRVVVDPDDSSRDKDFTYEIYRRKPEAVKFEFPTNRLAIVKGQRIGYDVSVNFVKTDSGWLHQSGSDYTVDTIKQYFHNFTVVFAGLRE